MTNKKLEQSQTTLKVNNKYSKEFIKAFRKLAKELDEIDLARILKISVRDVKNIKQEIGVV